MHPDAIPGLSAIADRYDTLLCDVWGVIHNGAARFDEACEALVRFGRERGPVVLISNAPRPHADVEPQLAALDVPREAWSGFVTSGDVTREELARRAPGPAWRIGPDRDAPLFEGLPLAFAGPGEAAFVACSGLVDDETETADDYREALSLAAGRGLPMICANPDRMVQRGDRLIPCAGALADLYAALGGEVVMAGKPHAPIYDRALAEAARLLGRPVDRARVLAVGDGLSTDVAGANAQGLPLLFIAAGVHAADLMDAHDALDPTRLAAVLAAAEARADHVMRDLAW